MTDSRNGSRLALRPWMTFGSVALLVIAPILLCPRSARAQSRATDKVAAQAMFEEGRRLMQSGDFATACPRLAESQRLDPAVGTLLYLGECYENNGQTASAWAAFRSAESAARNAKQPDREKIGRERAEALEPKLSKLTIVVPESVAVPGMELKRDGVTVGQASWGVPIPIDPGTHAIEASAPGKQSWSHTLRLGRNGAQERVVVPGLVDAPQAPAPTPPPATPGASARPSEPPPVAQTPTQTTHRTHDPIEADASSSGPIASGRGDTQRLLGVVAGVAGLAGVGVGAVYAYRSKDKRAESDDLCPTDTCIDQHALDLNEEAKSAASTANICFALGAAGVVGGIVLYATAPSDPDPPVGRRGSRGANVSVAVGPGFLGMNGVW